MVPTMGTYRVASSGYVCRRYLPFVSTAGAFSGCIPRVSTLSVYIGYLLWVFIMGAYIRCLVWLSTADVCIGSLSRVSTVGAYVLAAYRWSVFGSLVPHNAADVRQCSSVFAARHSNGSDNIDLNTPAPRSDNRTPECRLCWLQLRYVPVYACATCTGVRLYHLYRCNTSQCEMMLCTRNVRSYDNYPGL